MEIEKYAFLKFKDFLSEPVVTISEFYEIPSVPELFGKVNINGAYELPSFNGFYAGTTAQKEIDDKIIQLCQEIDNNCGYPTIREQKIDYLKEVLAYIEDKIEKSVLTEVNGTFEYDLTFVNYINVSFEDFDVSERLKVYYHTSRFLYESLLYIEDLVFKQLSKLNAVSVPKTSQRKPRKEFDSFPFRAVLKNNKELMDNLKEAMIDSKFITPNTTIDNFRAVFENRPIVDPIVWIGDKGALKSFVSRLPRNSFEEHVSDIWKIAAKCFVFIEGTKISHQDFYSIHTSKEGTGNDRKIFSLIKMIENARPK
jgi:hypothetical protein